MSTDKRVANLLQLCKPAMHLPCSAPRLQRGANILSFVPTTVALQMQRCFTPRCKRGVVEIKRRQLLFVRGDYLASIGVLRRTISFWSFHPGAYTPGYLLSTLSAP